MRKPTRKPTDGYVWTEKTEASAVCSCCLRRISIRIEGATIRPQFVRHAREDNNPHNDCAGKFPGLSDSILRESVWYEALPEQEVGE